MSTINIIFRDGEQKTFAPQGRGGGSYTNTVRYEPGFVVVVDEYGKQIAFPTDTVKSVEVVPDRW